MKLNSLFKNAIISNNYCYSVFDKHHKQINVNNLQICHILSNSKKTRNSIAKNTGILSRSRLITCIVNMPLLNTVVGTIEDNAEYKKTDDIAYIDSELIYIAYTEVIEPYLDFLYPYNKFLPLNHFLHFVKNVANKHYTRDRFDSVYTTKWIIHYQRKFQKHIDLYY